MFLPRRFVRYIPSPAPRPPRIYGACVQNAIHARIPDGAELGAVHHLGAGYVAGAMMVFATNPVWMIKTRMQLQNKNAKVGVVRPYSGLIGVLLHFRWTDSPKYNSTNTPCYEGVDVFYLALIVFPHRPPLLQHGELKKEESS